MPRRCALGCPYTQPYHSFPHPYRNPEQFKAWVNIVGGKLNSEDDYALYRKKVLCNIHFTDKDKNRNNRLNRLAVPSLHLSGKSDEVDNSKKESLWPKPIKEENILTTLKPTEIGKSDEVGSSSGKVLHKLVKEEISPPSLNPTVIGAEYGVTINDPPTTTLDDSSQAVSTERKYGSEIHMELVKRAEAIITQGLKENIRDKLVKKYLVPCNIKLLDAPKLNKELEGLLGDEMKARDKEVEVRQQQLGVAIAALLSTTDILINSDVDKTKLISRIMDVTLLLTDLHNQDTVTRKKQIIPNLESTVENHNRDEFLFGEKYQENVKAATAIKKSAGTILKQKKRNERNVAFEQNNPNRRNILFSRQSQSQNYPKKQRYFIGPLRMSMTRFKQGRGQISRTNTKLDAKTSTTSSSQDTYMTNLEEQNYEEDTQVQVIEEICSTPGESDVFIENRPAKRVKPTIKRQKEALALLKDARDSIVNRKVKDALDVFGEYVASELRDVKCKKQILELKKQIQDLIYYTKIEQITNNEETVTLHSGIDQSSNNTPYAMCDEHGNHLI